jgi:hypothetical protein
MQNFCSANPAEFGKGTKSLPELCDKQVTTFLVAITLRFPINCATFRHPSFLRELPP